MEIQSSSSDGKGANASGYNQESKSSAAPSRSSGNSNALINRYNRYKRIFRWALITLALVGIAYTILTARSESAPRSAMQNNKLGPEIFSNGHTVIVTAIRGQQQEVLVSTDNGATFIRTGDWWTLHDSSLYLGLAQDSQTVIALEKSGLLHIKPAGKDHFLSIATLTPPYSDSLVKGFILIPGTDSLYIYGLFTKVVGLSWKSPGTMLDYIVPRGQWVTSMAINQEKTISAVLENPQNGLRSVSYDLFLYSPLEVMARDSTVAKTDSETVKLDSMVKLDSSKKMIDTSLYKSDSSIKK